MDRRTFLARAGIAATWAGIPITIGCSDDDDPAGPGDGDVAGTVGPVDAGSQHPHDGAVVTEAQLQAGGAVMLTLTGSGHTHIANLTAPNVMAIANGEQVSVNTTDDQTGHHHNVTFN